MVGLMITFQVNLTTEPTGQSSHACIFINVKIGNDAEYRQNVSGILIRKFQTERVFW